MAKGLAILLVVAGHSRLDGTPLGTWITSFHMPFFFMVAGLCFDETRYSGFGAYFVRKLKALAYPYFMLSLFVAVWLTAMRISPGTNYFRMIFIDSSPPCEWVGGFWFVRTLFYTELLYALACKFLRRMSVRLVAALAVMIAVRQALSHFMPGDVSNVSFALFFYACGHTLRQAATQSRKPAQLAFAAAALLSVQIAILSVFGRSAPYGTTIPSTLAPLCGAAGLLAASAFTTAVLDGKAQNCVRGVGKIAQPARKLLDGIVWLGRHSLCLLVAHFQAGRCRFAWVGAHPGLNPVFSHILEYVLIAAIMYLLTGPLSLFARFPASGRRKESPVAPRAP